MSVSGVVVCKCRVEEGISMSYFLDSLYPRDLVGNEIHIVCTLFNKLCNEI